MTELAHPEQIAAAATHVTRDDLDGAVRISSDPARHVEWLREEIQTSADRFDRWCETKASSNHLEPA